MSCTSRWRANAAPATCDRSACSAGARRRIFSEGDAPQPEVDAAASEFVPVRLFGDAPAAPSADLTLVLRDGLRLEIGLECRAETLKRVLDVLRERT